jgi:DNA polymerase-2
MIFWLKDSKDGIIKIEDKKWNNYFYLANDNISNLEKVLYRDYKEIDNLIKRIEYVNKYEKVTDEDKSQVLKLYTSYIGNNTKFANLIERRIGRKNDFGEIRLYNTDLLPVQHYFFDYNIFPCATYNIEETPYGLFWDIVDKKNDDIESTNYYVPNFKIIYLKINFEKGIIPRFSDKLKSITIIIVSTYGEEEQKIDIQSESDEEKVILQLSNTVKKLNPDIIITENGDSFLFPYLIHRSLKNNINLSLNRDSDIPLLRKQVTKRGISYFSYGRTYYKPSSIRLYGRLHIDTSTSFVWRETQDVHGLVEISRLSRLPLHEASRATIGKCLTSLHLYNATKNDILIPWKPIISEHIKSIRKLFIADRGGLILEPEIGLHEKVAELDFVSLYPNIIYKKNISAETILCNCCYYLDSNNNKVPELNYHICKRKKGLIPKSLEIVLRKRIQYKNLKNKTTISSTNPDLNKIYDSRQSALKWILVTSFGYLGFSNAKFGRIDAHIAVCAFARDILLKSIKIAEKEGFEVLHGIVDSIWIKKDNATENDYIQLKKKIEKITGFEISFEGIYKWIAFLSSEQDSHIPVSNKYFGVFKDETLKIRGIETRRNDTPLYLSNFQREVLEVLAIANNINELRERLPEIKFIYRKYLLSLRERKVPLTDLIFTKQLSKNYDEYESRNTIENNAIKMLTSKKEFLKAGQLLKYVIVDYKRRRAMPSQLINDKTIYDIDRYSELLTEIYNSIIKIVN